MKHSGTVEIKTKRLVLRRFKMDDKESVFKNYGSDEKVNRFINWAPCQTMESTEEFLKMHMEKYDSDKSFYGWGIEVDGEIVGSIGAFDVDEELNKCEVGYSISSKLWGQGYVTEALKAVLKHLFEEVGFNRVFASHNIENIGSGKVMQKAGMIYEGTAREGTIGKDGKYKDLVFYSICKRDWDKNKTF